MQKNDILTFSCPDQTGIQARITGVLYTYKAFLHDVQSCSDTGSNTFFSRIAYSIDSNTAQQPDFLKAIQALAKELQLNWRIDEDGIKVRTIIAVSKEGHCLNDLLYRAKYSDLPIDIVGVVSNHEDFRQMVQSHGIAYHYLPVEKNPASKQQQEQQFEDIVSQENAELIVLARYMQILSDKLSTQWLGKCINIHHSFLPSFKGSDPYRQAYDRGVKIIGATAHYVTPDLDEGPIIEQDIAHVSHTDSPTALKNRGRDIETGVLGRSVRWHAEKKIFIDGCKTIVFR